MTDKEKMIAGLPYQANGELLFKERQRAKTILQRFNQLHPEKIRERKGLLKQLLRVKGGRFLIEPPFFCDYGYNIQLGDNVYANYHLTILDSAPVEIGDDVLIGPHVSIFTAGHPIDPQLRVEGWEFALPVRIGDRAWIGGHTVINPGVSIGQNTVIGSGAVVTRDIPDNVVAAGNPCRVLREINDRDREFYADNLRYLGS